jgi:hypothetical protein
MSDESETLEPIIIKLVSSFTDDQFFRLETGMSEHNRQLAIFSDLVFDTYLVLLNESRMNTNPFLKKKTVLDLRENSCISAIC